jgi:hypothetical protein
VPGVRPEITGCRGILDNAARDSSKTLHHRGHPGAAAPCQQRAKLRLQQKACLLGGLPNLHNPRHSNCPFGAHVTTDKLQEASWVEAHLNKPLAGRPDAAILEIKYLGDNIFYSG